MTVVFLSILSISELLLLFTGVEVAATLVRVAFIGLCFSLVPSFRFREWSLGICAIILVLGLFYKNNNMADIVYSLDRAAFFASFIYLVTLLKEAAQRSASVLKLGAFMTNQPSGKRYFSLAFGGHFMGVLLNFGAISLLTPLIQRGAKAGVSGLADAADQQAKAAILEQQQLSALLRGFSWMIMWSPTALTQAVLFTSFPGVDLKIVIPLGMLLQSS